MKASYEYTDTYAGEANYSWVKRGIVNAKTVRGIIQKVKKELGLTNCRTIKDNYGEMISIKPVGSCTAIFIELL